jgi:hypothetical protein
LDKKNENEKRDKKRGEHLNSVGDACRQNNHQVKWEDVSVLAKKSNTKKNL